MNLLGRGNEQKRNIFASVYLSFAESLSR